MPSSVYIFEIDKKSDILMARSEKQKNCPVYIGGDQP
jgi:hypothetical protein